VDMIVRAARAFSSPFQAVSRDAEWSLSEMLTDESTRSPADILFESRRAESVRKVLGSIDDRAARILRMRFGLEGGDPLTLKEIGEKIGLTRERIRQIEHHTLQCINKAIRSQEEEVHVPVAQG